MTSNRITHLVEEFSRLEEARDAANKAAKDAGLDPAALRRAAMWKPENGLKRQVQAAIDHQVRYLSGRETKPASIPPKSDLARAAALLAKGMSARDIGAELGFGKTKANQLTQQAELFGVRKTADADSDGKQ